MKPSDITKLANDLTDETLDFQTVLGFINAGISEINAELNSQFPRVTAADEEFVFPETWQDLVLVPYVSAKIKQKDSSQFEYMDLYGQFREGLLKMKAKYTVPDEFLSSDLADNFEPDYTGNYNNWG